MPVRSPCQRQTQAPSTSASPATVPLVNKAARSPLGASSLENAGHVSRPTRRTGPTPPPKPGRSIVARSPASRSVTPSRATTPLHTPRGNIASNARVAISHSASKLAGTPGRPLSSTKSPLVRQALHPVAEESNVKSVNSIANQLAKLPHQYSVLPDRVGLLLSNCTQIDMPVALILMFYS